jgi:SagB-type dehydrogenase family enzyme
LASHLPSPLVELWSLREDTLVEHRGTDVLVETRWGDTRLDSPPSEITAVLRMMSLGPVSLDNVVPGFSRDPGPQGSPQAAALQAVLRRLGNATVRSLAASDGSPLLSVVPVSANAFFQPDLVELDRLYRLSAFAVLRYSVDGLMLESPLSYYRVSLHHTEAGRLAARLGIPATGWSMMTEFETLAELDMRRLLGYLVAAGVVVQDGPAAFGSFPEDSDPVLENWAPYELMMHARSRLGRSDLPFGDVGSGGKAPAGPVPDPGQRLGLHVPDIAELTATDPPLSAVMDERRSLREYGRWPMTAGQLGSLLHRAVRVRGGHRPYPSLASAYPVRVYLLVQECSGLAPGAYRYAPEAHELEVVQGPEWARAEVLRQAQAFAGLPAFPQVLLVMTAQISRIASHKGLAYSSVLKEVGALQQTLYLVCTAMNLAPCALASGDSDACAQAFGLDWASEPSVGEFIVGSGVVP